MADSDLEQAAAALGLGDDLPCGEPGCDRTFTNERSRAQHRRTHKPAPEAKAAPTPAPSEVVVEEVIGKTVANLQVLGGYVSIVLPHTGLAIAGVPHPDSVPDPETGRAPRPNAEPIVRSRAVIAGRVLKQWALRDERVLKALDRFNALFEASEIVELAAGLGAAVAVDVGAVPADLAIEIGPFQGANAIQPVRAVIGDVIAYVDQVRAEVAAQQTEPVSPDGRAPDGAAVILGGVTDT